MTKIYIFIFALFPLILGSCNKNTWPKQDVYKYTYGSLNNDTFPISGWVAPTAKWNCNNKTQYRYLKESGLTSIYSLYEKYSEEGGNDEVYKALELANDFGIQYLVRDDDLWNHEGEEFKTEFIKRNYTNYPGFAGFFYGDEPYTKERVDKIVNDYSKFKQYIPEHDSKYAFILNNLAYNSSAFKSVNEYLNFIQDLINRTKLPYFSFDFYAPTLEFPHVKPEFFKALNVVAEWSNKNKIPFWAFALSSGHKFTDTSSRPYYRHPTERDIYWQVNNALAYGAKGLTYFCYQVPVGDSRETYVGQGGSFIDEKGERTDVYYYGQNINKYIHSIEHILMNMTKIGMIKHETGTIGAQLDGTFVDSIREIKSLETNDDVLVSVFDYNGKTVCYCVNTSLVNNASFKINFTNKCNYKSYLMNQETMEYTSSVYNGILEPGRAVLIELI